MAQIKGENDQVLFFSKRFFTHTSDFYGKIISHDFSQN